MFPVSTSIPETLEQMEWLCDEIIVDYHASKNICQNIFSTTLSNQATCLIFFFVIDELAEILMDKSNENRRS